MHSTASKHYYYHVYGVGYKRVQGESFASIMHEIKIVRETDRTKATSGTDLIDNNLENHYLMFQFMTSEIFDDPYLRLFNAKIMLYAKSVSISFITKT